MMRVVEMRVCNFQVSTEELNERMVLLLLTQTKKAQ